MMAMSLADRPRPALLQVRSILKGQLFSFVWLPREELTTARRTAIEVLLENEVGREVTSWSVELGDGDLALIRYTQYIDEEAPSSRCRSARMRPLSKWFAAGRPRSRRN